MAVFSLRVRSCFMAGSGSLTWPFGRSCRAPAVPEVVVERLSVRGDRPDGRVFLAGPLLFHGRVGQSNLPFRALLQGAGRPRKRTNRSAACRSQISGNFPPCAKLLCVNDIGRIRTLSPNLALL